jgi:hypothetical protein
MTAPMDDTLTALGRQLSTAYLPIVQEPLPRELKDLLAQLVASEMRKGDSIASPLMAQLEPDPSSTDPSIGR